MRSLFITIGVALAGTVAIGVLHLPAARPWLAAVGVPCPVESVSTASVQAMHTQAVKTLATGADAPVRRAFGLDLAAARDVDVRTWASTRGLNCETRQRGLGYLSCRDVPSAAVGDDEGEPVQDLTMTFEAGGRLIGVDALYGGLEADAAARLAGAIERRLDAELGPASSSAGSFTGGYLHDGPFRTAFRRYQFHDYVVSLTAVHIPGTGVVVRAQHVAVRRSEA